MCVLVSYAQLYVMLAQQKSEEEASKKDDHLQKAAENLELTLTRLSPSDKEVKCLLPPLSLCLYLYLYLNLYICTFFLLSSEERLKKSKRK